MKTVVFVCVFQSGDNPELPIGRTAAFEWTGERWRLKYALIFDERGLIKRTVPASAFKPTWQRLLSEAVLDKVGRPYSEKYQEALRGAGMPIINI